MGSPVSPVVANLCMEVIEESAIAASTTPPKVWKRYVDDSFVIIKEHSVSKFHDTLNAVDPKISFTIETENNGQISFLDTLITRKNGAVTIGVYRKPTHTDRYLDLNSHHELKHKISTASTLLNRALNLPSTAEGVRKELTHVSNALKSNGYPSATISNILKKNSTSEVIPSPEELVGMLFRWTDPPDSQNGFAVLPYIKGVTEPLTRILNNNGIRATTRPVKTLHMNRNLRLPNQDLHQIGKRTLSIKSPVRTAHGIISEKRVDAYTLEKRNTYETPKFLKVVPMLPAMRGSRAKLLILRMHASSTEAIHGLEKRWNPGTLQLLARQTIILSSCQDNTQFYCNLIHHKYFFCISVFIHIRSLFSHLFLHIYFYLRFLHLTFLKIADWQSKAQCF